MRLCGQLRKLLRAKTRQSKKPIFFVVSFLFDQVNQTEEYGSMRPNVAIVWKYPDPNNPLIITASAKEQTWYYITSIATNLDTKFNPLSEALYQWDEAML